MNVGSLRVTESHLALSPDCFPRCLQSTPNSTSNTLGASLATVKRSREANNQRGIRVHQSRALHPFTGSGQLRVRTARNDSTNIPPERQVLLASNHKQHKPIASAITSDAFLQMHTSMSMQLPPIWLLFARGRCQCRSSTCYTSKRATRHSQLRSDSLTYRPHADPKRKFRDINRFGGEYRPVPCCPSKNTMHRTPTASRLLDLAIQSRFSWPTTRELDKGMTPDPGVGRCRHPCPFDHLGYGPVGVMLDYMVTWSKVPMPPACPEMPP